MARNPEAQRWEVSIPWLEELKNDAIQAQQMQDFHAGMGRLLALIRIVEMAQEYCQEIRLQGYAKGPLPGDFDDLEDAIKAAKEMP